MREKTFNMRLTEDEWERFEAVSAYHEVSVAAMIRRFFLVEHERLDSMMTAQARDDWKAQQNPRKRLRLLRGGKSPPKKRR